MGRTVEELNASLSIDEFHQWIAYTALEPWGEDRADWRTAHSNAVMANMWSSSKKKLQPKDFLLQFTKKSHSTIDKGNDINKWNALLLKAMFRPKS